MEIFIGDVRDYKRLEHAMEGVDYVAHAAALAQVPASEYNLVEFAKPTSLEQNVIYACIRGM